MTLHFITLRFMMALYVAAILCGFFLEIKLIQ